MPPPCGSEEVLATLKGLEINILKANGNFNGFPLTPDRFIATDPVTLASDEKLRRRTCSVKMVYMISDRSRELLQSLASNKDDARLIPIAKNYISSVNLSFLQLRPEELAESNPGAAGLARLALATEIASCSQEIERLGRAKDGKISLAPSKVQYTVRVNEDQNVKTSFVVDSELSKDAIRAVLALECYRFILKNHHHQLQPLRHSTHLQRPRPQMAVANRLLRRGWQRTTSQTMPKSHAWKKMLKTQVHGTSALRIYATGNLLSPARN